MLQQQERFDTFVEHFNKERPHEALGQRPPATVYVNSDRSYADALKNPDYPLHDLVLNVSSSGSIYLPGRKAIYVSSTLAGQPLGLRELDDGRWLVTFVDLDLGHVEGHGFEAAEGLLG